jgi:hypothetical protein
MARFANAFSLLNPLDGRRDHTWSARAGSASQPPVAHPQEREPRRRSRADFEPPSRDIPDPRLL